MKRIFFLISLLFIGLSRLAAFETLGQPIGMTQAIATSDLHEEWTICLEDGSCWDLLELDPNRKRTWGEWWNGIKPQEWNFDESFCCDPSSWRSREAIQIYEVRDEIFEGFKYIIENTSTGKKVFAKWIPFGAKLLPKLDFAKVFFSFPWKEARIESNQSMMNHAFIMDDGSIWLVSKVNKREPSWGNWWKGREIDQPDLPFLFELTEWKEGDPLQFYYLEKTNISGSELKDKWLFLIQNKASNQLAYATPISVVEFANLYQQYSITAYNNGYENGYNAGYGAGVSAGANECEH